MALGFLGVVEAEVKEVVEVEAVEMAPARWRWFMSEATPSMAELPPKARLGWSWVRGKAWVSWSTHTHEREKGGWGKRGKKKSVVFAQTTKKERKNGRAYLVGGIAREDDAAVVPVLEDVLLEGERGGAGAAPPDLAKQQRLGDGPVGDELGEGLGVGVGVAPAVRPGEGLVEAEDDEEVDGVGLRGGEEGEPLVVGDDEVALAELGDRGGHHDERLPLGPESCAGWRGGVSQSVETPER